jgi:hypothetical protein
MTFQTKSSKVNTKLYYYFRKLTLCLATTVKRTLPGSEPNTVTEEKIQISQLRRPRVVLGHKGDCTGEAQWQL